MGFIWETASCLKLLRGCRKTSLIILTIAAFSGPCGLWNVCVGAWSWHVLRCCGWSDAVVLYIFCKDRCSVKPKIQAFASVSNNPAWPLALSATCSLKGWICSATAQEEPHPSSPHSRLWLNAEFFVSRIAGPKKKTKKEFPKTRMFISFMLRIPLEEL